MSYLLCMDNVSKSFGKKKVLDGISLKLKSNKIVGLISPNGSGKTTLIKLIMDYLTLDEGSITVDGISAGPMARDVIAYLPDRAMFNNNRKISYAVSYYETAYSDFDKAKCEKYLKTFEINTDETISSLSKGTAEILYLILTLSRNAKLYLIDEPLASVDPVNREIIITTILREFNEDSTVIISTHLLNEVETILDEVVMIKDNKLFCHKSVEEIREETGKSLNEFFKDSFRKNWFGGDK